jgi:parvulin-like peptidyl-prolyl isomerase
VKRCVSLLAVVLVLALAVRALAQPSDPYAPYYQQQPQPVYQQPQFAQPPFQQPVQPPGQPYYGQPVVQRPVFGPPHAGTVQASATGQPELPQMTAPPQPQADLFEPAQIIARVGDKAIFYGDVAPTVNQILEPALAKAKSDVERQQIEQAREVLVKNVLRQQIENKLMYLEFEREMLRHIGGDAENLNTTRREMDKKIAEGFEESLAKVRQELAKAGPEETQALLRRDAIIARLAILMKEHQAETLGDLDNLLRRYGTSLAQQVRQFGESELGKQMMYKNIRRDPEVTHQEMLDYYRQHAEDYFLPAKARFEILSVRFANFRDRNEAWNAICAMGNEVYYGKPLGTVARQSSQEPQASQGGQYDWTTKGSLASKPIDHAVFSLEPGKLSQVIEDERGFHIVRVLERQQEGYVSFLDAQPKIKDAIKSKKREEDYKKFLAGLSTRTQVWTVYDEAAVAKQPGGAMQR